MSVQIVLPQLPNWVEQRVTALYTAKNADDFSSAFDAFVAKDVTIRVNGKSVSRDAYKKLVQGQITGDAGAQVTFNGIVSVPTTSKDLNDIGTGSVGAMFNAVVTGRLFIFGIAESSTVNSSLNVVVIHDSSLHHHQVGHGGAFDARRVSVIDEVFTDQPNKIVPPHTGLPPTTTSA